MRCLHSIALALVVLFVGCQLLNPGAPQRIDDCDSRWRSCVVNARSKPEGLACLHQVDVDPKCADWARGDSGGAGGGGTGGSGGGK